jgi:hypothetical protein
MADSHSGHTWVKLLYSQTAASIIRICEDWFKDFGYPKEIISDNGPQFRSEFARYCNDKSIIHTTSSPYYPEANGMAESGVRNMKDLLLKSKSQSEFTSGILAWRNTPSSDCKLSPSEKFFGRRQRFGLPVYEPTTQHKLETPDTVREQTSSKAEGDQQANKNPVQTRSKSERSRQPRRYMIGDRVRVQDEKTKRWTIRATVLEIRKSGCSYVLQFDGASGKQLTARNSVFMRPLIEAESCAERARPLLESQISAKSQPAISLSRDHRQADKIPDSDSGFSSEDIFSSSPPLRRSTRATKHTVRFSC